METAPEIVFNDMDPSDFVRDRIADEIGKLEHLHGRITSCRVVVETPHRQHHKGKLFGVRIHLTAPGRTDVAVNHEQGDRHEHEDVYVAIRDAFAAARRQLKDKSRRQQGKVKSHDPALFGRVARLIAEQDYGFIESTEGQEVYFHANTVLGGMTSLEVGSEVRFDKELGEKGMQATTVHPVGRRRPH